MTEQTAAAEIVRDLTLMSAGPRKLGLGEYHAWLSPGGQLHEVDLTGDRWLDFPKRRSGTVTVRNLASFRQYWDKHHDDDSDVFADLDKGTVTAVLDAHRGAGATERGDGDAARWQQHRLVLKLERTLPWLRWADPARDRKLMSQLTFAEFIEENATDVDPKGRVSAATLLEVAQEFHARTTGRFTKGTRLATGQTQFEWTEEITASAGRTGKATIEIPTEFDLRIWPYEDCEPATLAARFRYRINNGDLQLGYLLNNPERVAQEAVASVVEKLAATCGVTVMYGQPA